jgi:sec-independent protein translocase protein TatA
MFGLGPMELIIILVIILIIFGAGKLPEIGGGMGKAIRNFKSGVKDTDKKDQKPEQIEKEENS